MKLFVPKLIILILATANTYAEECFQMVEKSDLQSTVINGEEVFVVKKNAVQTQCNLYQQARQAALKAQAENKKLLALVDEMNSKYKDLYEAKESYFDLLLKYDTTLGKSSALINDFESHSQRWADLYKDYAKLADDYEKLSETYRAIAMNFDSPVSFDIGGGVTESEGFAGLIGVGVYRVKIWGFLQENNNGILATYTFPWTSL